MSDQQADPRPDPRRSEALFRDLQQRAQTWLPNWQGIAAEADTTARGDFGRAFLQLAARINAEVTQRLDQTPNKAALGMLDWLAIAARPGHAARMPVVLKARANGKQTVFAKAPLKFQVNTPDAPIPFESQQDIRVVPGSLIRAAALDPAADELYQPPPSLLRTEAPPALPTRWIVKSVVGQTPTGDAGGEISYDRLQLDPPELGLDANLWLQIGQQQYRIAEKADGGLVRITPALPGDNLPQAGDKVRLVQSYAPFSGGARNLQAHYLYIGDENALNLIAPALIDLQGAQVLYGKCNWSYWGKANKDAEPAWLPLKASLPDTEAEDEGDGAGKPKSAESGDILRLIKEESGIAEIVEIAGRKTRWLRALADPAQIGSTALTFEGIRLKIQSAGNEPQAMPAMEAVSNTTSIVLNDRFYPFGKFPHQFDSFFLACKEVFSKPGAKVTLTAEIAGRTLGPLVGWPMWSNGIATAAAGQDGNLHIFHASPNAVDNSLFDWSLFGSFAPASATAEAGAADAASRFGGFSADFAPARIKQDGNSASVTLCLPAGRDAWAWSEPSTSGSKWRLMGSPAIDADILQLAATGRLASDGNASLLALLAGGKKVAARLFNQVSLIWQNVAGLDDTEWSRIIPLLNPTDVSGEQFGLTDRALLLAASGTTIGVLQCTNGSWRLTGKLACPIGWSGNRTPLAWRWHDGTQDQIYIAQVQPASATTTDGLGIAAWNGLSGALPLAVLSYRVDCRGRVVGDAPSLALSGTTFSHAATPMWLALCVASEGGAVKPAWVAVPRQDGGAIPVLQTETSLPPGTPGQSPIFVGKNLVVPGTSQDLMSDGFVPFRLRTLSVAATRSGNGIMPSESIQPDDWVQWQADQPRLWRLTQTPPVAPFVPTGSAQSNASARQTRQWLLVPQLPASGSATVLSVDGDHGFSGKIIGGNRLRTVYDIGTQDESFHLMLRSSVDPDRAYHVEIIRVDIYAGRNEDSFLELIFKVPVNENDPAPLWDAWIIRPEEEAQFHTITYEARAGIWLAANNPQTSALTIGEILHDNSANGQPLSQTVAGIHPQTSIVGGTLVMLGSLWSVFPQADGQGNLQFSFDTGGSSKWSRYAVASAAAPDLSWEYWNGTGWWKIEDTDDRTGDFRQSGKIIFTVPRDIGQTDVLGRQNFWIRARLVGGDYGRETYSLTDSTNPDNAVTRSVTISTDNIHAPQMVSLKIAYQLNEAIWPQTVLTQDTLSWLDQSLANRSPGARVSAFMPPLQRLQAMGAQQLGRSLFIALQNQPERGPVRIFFKVDEADLSAFAPLKVEALAEGRFVPVLADDDTRALGENGLLTLQFDQVPSQSELFGQTAYWLRLYPGANSDKWTPSLQGAYLNAVWAEAAQGRSMDVLGSSDASPNQSVKLVGAPVLAHSLELRVRETLGSEERAALLAQGELVADPPGMPGDWVLWHEVADPADAAGEARVYALDPVGGVIRFGDGKRGAVPPLGRNNIVAFAWRRGGGARANGLAAFTAVNLVGPIEGVEGAFNPDIATGGAEPENAAGVARFAPARLRMRERIITIADVEQATLDFSGEWVQVRALPRGNRINLVGVARGENPLPGQAQRRALGAYLAAHADPLLAARIDIGAPRLWPFSLTLELTVPTLDAAGAVGTAVEAALERWFDAAHGGPARRGIPLGAAIEADDIACALFEVDDLESLDRIVLQALDADHLPLDPKRRAELPRDQQARADLPADALPRLIALNLKFSTSGVA